MNCSILTVTALTLLLTGVGQAKAGIIFSNLGPGDSYNGGDSYGITGSGAIPGYPGESLSMGFAPTTTAVLSEVELALGFLSGTNSVVVELQNDNAGKPGSVIESWSISNLPVFGAASSGDLSVAFSSLDPTLTAGTQYWLTVLPGASDTEVGWYRNSIGQNAAAMAISHDGGSTWTGDDGDVALAFRIDSADSAVAPEPATITLLGIGIAGIAGYGGYGRRRRK